MKEKKVKQLSHTHETTQRMRKTIHARTHINTHILQSM